MQYVIFDLEISKILPDVQKLRDEYRALKAQGASPAILRAKAEEGKRAQDWDNFRPLGISCAATLTSDDELKLWHGAETRHDSRLPSRMLPNEAAALAGYLYDMHSADYAIVGWNSLGFDFKILWDECGDWKTDRMLCKELALNHIDIMFHFFCGNGYRLGLDKACKGMGLKGKTKGMHGGKAPEMWAQERRQQELVLEYCAQDVRATGELYEAITRRRCIEWTSDAGNPCSWQVEKLLPVCEALALPEPDTSWMSDPWPRSKFYGWME